MDSLHVNNLLSLHDHGVAPAERDLYALMINERLDLLNAAGIPLYVEDARDYHRMSKTFTAFEPNVVVLLAAVSHASRANKDPMRTLDHSFRSLENALDNSRGSSPVCLDGMANSGPKSGTSSNSTDPEPPSSTN